MGGDFNLQVSDAGGLNTSDPVAEDHSNGLRADSGFQLVTSTTAGGDVPQALESNAQRQAEKDAREAISGDDNDPLTQALRALYYKWDLHQNVPQIAPDITAQEKVKLASGIAENDIPYTDKNSLALKDIDYRRQLHTFDPSKPDIGEDEKVRLDGAFEIDEIRHVNAYNKAASEFPDKDAKSLVLYSIAERRALFKSNDPDDPDMFQHPDITDQQKGQLAEARAVNNVPDTWDGSQQLRAWDLQREKLVLGLIKTTTLTTEQKLALEERGLQFPSADGQSQ